MADDTAASGSIEYRQPGPNTSLWREHYLQGLIDDFHKENPDADPEYAKAMENWIRGVIEVIPPTDEESAAYRSAHPELVGPPELDLSSQLQMLRLQNADYPPPPSDMSFGLPDIANIKTAGPGYKYGTGMDFGIPDIVPGGWTDPEEQRLRNTDPFNKELQLGGKYYREINQGGRDTFGFDTSTGMIKSPEGGWTNPEELYLRNYDPKNSVFNPGGRYYREPPAWSLGDSGFPAPPTTGPRYQYTTGMDFGRPDIVPGGWTNPEEQNLRINDPGNTALQLGGKYYRQIDPSGIAQFGLNTSTGMLNDPGWTNPEEMYLRNYDADNSAFIPGGRYYREPPAHGLGDPGFPTPPTTGPRYQYGTGMDFGLTDIVPGGWTNPEEQNLRINDPGNTALQLGGKYYRQIDPGGIAQFGLNTSTGMLNDPGWTNPEEMYLRNYDADNSAFNPGGAYYREPSGYVPASTLNGFSTSGVSNPGYQTTMPAAAEQVGGFSPGDMGDAITNQQTEYMNAARAAAAQEAAYQQRVQSERAAVDASLAAAAAQRNNPLYNPSAQYSNISNPTVNLSGGNPTDIFNHW